MVLNVIFWASGGSIKLKISILTILIWCCAALALPANAQYNNSLKSTIFTNPVINSDIPDPDIVRVGEDFYLVCGSYVNVPGLAVMHSKDLVHWEHLSYMVDELKGRRQYDMQGGDAYRSGITAPSIRYDDGRFYIAVTPAGQKTELYYADDPKGPWKCNELNCGAYNPALLFDDGKAYILTVGSWDGTVILLTLNDEFNKVVRQEKIHFIEGAEGSKIIKKDGMYYLFNTIASKKNLVVSRASELHGPWEIKDQISNLDDGCRGAIVDLPEGQTFGFASRVSGAVGREMDISPVYWQEGWPVWGSLERAGKIVKGGTIPLVGEEYTFIQSDDFSGEDLGGQLQWNHNPDKEKWSLTEREGWLRMEAVGANDMWSARNVLLARAFTPKGVGEVKADLSGLKPGDIFGFGTFGGYCGYISVQRGEDGKNYLRMNVFHNTEDGFIKEDVTLPKTQAGDIIYLQTEMDFQTGSGSCSFSLDGESWIQAGEPFGLEFDMKTGTGQGQQFCIFCYNQNPQGGYVEIDYFNVEETE